MSNFLPTTLRRPCIFAALCTSAIASAGWRTLFVLPGGPGNAEVHSFVTNIAKHEIRKGIEWLEQHAAENARR